MIMEGNRACTINYAKIRVVGTSNISLSRAIKLAKHFEIDPRFGQKYPSSIILFVLSLEGKNEKRNLPSYLPSFHRITSSFRSLLLSPYLRMEETQDHRVTTALKLLSSCEQIIYFLPFFNSAYITRPKCDHNARHLSHWDVYSMIRARKSINQPFPFPFIARIQPNFSPNFSPVKINPRERRRNLRKKKKKERKGSWYNQ